MTYASSFADNARNVADCVKGASTAWEFIVAGELALVRNEKWQLHSFGRRAVLVGYQSLDLRNKCAGHVL